MYNSQISFLCDTYFQLNVARKSIMHPDSKDSNNKKKISVRYDKLFIIWIKENFLS